MFVFLEALCALTHISITNRAARANYIKPKNWGVPVLVSEIKCIGNAVFLEALVM